VEVFFVNDITANQELISPVALVAHGKISSNPPAGLVRPTKSFDVSSGLANMVLYALAKQAYPWM
jgi:hypothetical protein